MRLTDFGQTMQRYRMYHGMTQEELAQTLGVRSKYISFLENGHRAPGPAVQLKMEELLSHDVWGRVMLSQDNIISDEEMQLILTLHRRLCEVSPENRDQCIQLISHILKTMGKPA